MILPLPDPNAASMRNRFAAYVASLLTAPSLSCAELKRLEEIRRYQSRRMEYVAANASKDVA